MERYRKLTILIAIAVLCAATASAGKPGRRHARVSSSADPGWLQYGFGGDHTSFNDSETILMTSNVADIALRWSANVGTQTFPGMVSGQAPVVGRGIVYFAGSGMIFAFQASDGTLLWSQSSCSGADVVEPALGSEALLVGDVGGQLAAYDPGTGGLLWCSDMGGPMTAALSVDGNSVFITNGSDVVAVDQTSGAELWRFTPANVSRVATTPAISNQVVYVNASGSVFALDEASGQPLWRTDIYSCCSFYSSLAVVGNTVYVGGPALYALSAADGSLLWTGKGVVNASMPAIDDGVVFVNSQDPQFGLWAFDSTNGAPLWRNPAAGESDTTVAVANGIVFDTQDGWGRLIMFDAATGNLLGSVTDPGGGGFYTNFGTQPAVVNGTVWLVALEPDGSKQLEAFGLPQSEVIAPGASGSSPKIRR